MPKLVITNYPQKISSDPFKIDVLIEGAKYATNYLRVLVYKEGDNNYFAETFNGKEWVKNGNGKNYFPIEINSASTSATLEARVVDVENGDYKLKIRRFTSSGNSADDEVQEVNLFIENIKNTPTPRVEIIPTNSSRLLSTVDIVTPEPTVSVKKINSTPISKSENVLAAETQSPIETKDIEIEDRNQNFIPTLILLFGLTFVGISLFPFVRRKLKEYTK